LKVPTVEGIHLLYLEINKISSLSRQPICNSARVSCAPGRTKQPKFYPQEMGIILKVEVLIKFTKSQN
ncbi:hypothetical protein, partial [Acinetobacter lwoffii]|uniref:hypothetical protein n=1 Tax=Acinetobacter lwoffii TaxID=28090 RepID=UPI00286BF697